MEASLVNVDANHVPQGTCGATMGGGGEEFEFLHKKIYVEKNIFKLKKNPTTSRQAISYVEESLGRRIDSSMFKSCSIGVG